ncbi:MAG: endonuclease/exonuclease/phosphatase family protein [Kofleriaceae bacterium]|nr:endonuclease/exonuclease/phosphatase family protein [Kofleriaceae bacterium]
MSMLLKLIILSFATFTFLASCFDTGQIAGTEWVPVESLPSDRFAPEVSATQFDSSVATTTFRFATYNVHFARSPEDFVATMLAHPELSKIDVMSVQELTAYPDEGMSRAQVLAEGLSMNYVYVPWGSSKDVGTNGIGLFSKYPLRNIEVRALARRDSLNDTNYAIAADIVVNGKTIRVVTIHLGLRIGIGARIRQMHPIVESVPEPVLLGGDFNTNSLMWNNGIPLNQGIPILPSGTLDLRHESKFDEYMEAYGYQAPTKLSGPTQHSFAGDFRLDSIFSKGVTVTNTGIVRDLGLSDHDPLWVDILVE